MFYPNLLNSNHSHNLPHDSEPSRNDVPCRRLASFDYDLEQWREYQEGKAKGGKEWLEGFKLMDADGGAAWDLATHVCPPHLCIVSPHVV